MADTENVVEPQTAPVADNVAKAEAARKPLPVWDPETSSLKAVPFDDALKLQDDGYKVGDDAQQYALRNSGTAQLASGIGAFANTYTAGAFNALLAATGQNAMLRDEKQAQADNPKSAIGGTLGGIATSALAGPLQFGGLPGGALEAAQGVRGLGSLAKVANIGLQGAPAFAAQGALDSYTEQKMLEHPVSIEAMASSAATDVLWNAGLGVVTHGVLRAPSMIRSSFGNMLDKLEDLGLKRNYHRVLDDEGASKVTSHTKIFDVTYPDGVEPGSAGAEPIITPITRQLGPAVETAQDSAKVIDVADLGNVEPTERPAHLRAMEEKGPFFLSGEIEPAPEMPSKVLQVQAKHAERPELPPVEYPALETPRRATVLPVPDSPLGKELSGATGGSQPNIPRAEIPGNDVAEPSLSLNPDDYEVGFQYDPKASKINRITTLRHITLSRLKEVGEEATDKWDRVRDIAAEYRAVKEQKDFPNQAIKLQNLLKEKEKLHEELHALVPKEIDKATGVYKPGYSELRRENARLHGKVTDKTPVGSYGPTISKESKAAAKSAAAAEKAEQQHQKALARYQAKVAKLDVRRAQAIERQRAKDTQELLRAAEQDEKAAQRAKTAEDRAAVKQRQAELKAQKQAAEKEAKLERLKIQQEERLAKEELQRELSESRRLKAEAVSAEKAARAAEKAKPPKPKSKSTETLTGQRQLDDGSMEYHTQTVSQGGGKTRVRHKVTIKAPKVEERFVAGDYEPIFSGGATGSASMAAAYTHNPLLMSAAAFMHGANFLTKVASHRQAIGNGFERMFGTLGKISSPVIRQGVRAKWIQDQGISKPSRHDEKDYQAAVESIRAASANPEMVQDYIQQRYPNVSKSYPEVAQGVGATIAKMAQELNSLAAKKPYDPPLRDGAFLPPRARQVAFMRGWGMLANPQQAVENGDLAQMPMLRNVLPNLSAHQRDMLMRHIRNASNPISPSQARQFSAYLSVPVRSIDDAGAMKRSQSMAGPPPMQPSKGGAAMAQPSKISQQATQRDAPDADLDRL